MSEVTQQVHAGVRNEKPEFLGASPLHSRGTRDSTLPAVVRYFPRVPVPEL